MTRYQVKRSRGLCGDCGRVESVAARCEECKLRNADGVAARYAARRSAGLCIMCARISLERARCAPCEMRNRGRR